MGLDVNWTALAFILSVVANLATAGTWVFVYIGRRHSATDGEVDALGNRLTAVETILAAQPTQHLVHELDKHIVALSGKVDTLSARLGGMGDVVDRLERIVNRHEDHLLGASGR